MRWISATLCVDLRLGGVGTGARRQPFVRTCGAPFSFFHPAVEVDADELARIRGGHVVTGTIRSSEDDLAVLAAGSLKTTPDARVTEIVRLRKSGVVPAIGRFSNPPTIEDLAGLTLSPEDEEDPSECRLGDCGLKLAAPEIRRMQAAL